MQVPATEHVQDHQVPERLGLGEPIAELAGERQRPLGELASSLRVEPRRRGREQRGERHLGGERSVTVAGAVREQLHRLVVRDRLVEASRELERAAARGVEVLQRLLRPSQTHGRLDRLLVVRDGLGVGVQPRRVVAGDGRIRHRPLVVSRLLEVAHEQRRELLDPVRVQLLEDLTDAPVELAANAEQDRAVGGLLREAVVERVLPVG